MKKTAKIELLKLSSYFSTFYQRDYDSDQGQTFLFFHFEQKYQFFL